MMEKTSIKKCGGVDVGVCLNVDYTIFSLSIYNLQPIFTTKSTSTRIMIIYNQQQIMCKSTPCV